MHAGIAALIAFAIITLGWSLITWWAHDGQFGSGRYELIPAAAVSAVIAGLVTFVWGLVVMIMLLMGATCNEQAEKLGTTAEYGWISGCFIEWNGELVPYDLVRLNEDL